MTDSTLHSPMIQLTIEGMDCADCALTVQKGVQRLAGVQSVQVNFATQKMEVIGTATPHQIQERVQALGYRVADENTSAPSILIPITDIGETSAQITQAETPVVLRFMAYLLQRPEMQYVVMGLSLALLSLPLQLVDMHLTQNLLAVSASLAVAPTLLQGIKSLRFSGQFTIPLLTSIAVIGAVAIGEYWEALLVITLYSVGEGMEGYVSERARDNLRSLKNLTPQFATRLEVAENGQRERVVPTSSLGVGDVIRVRPYEMIPMDGEIQAGQSAVNQASFTGESVPVDKSTGDAVFAGTLNGQGLLTIRVTSLAENTALNRLIDLVQKAESERAPTQRVIEKFAQWYTPLIFSLAVLVALLPPLILGEPIWASAEANSALTANKGWLYRALILLVIACPCALVLSAPITVISSITAAARQGILIKGGRHLENLGRLKAIAFDKTGTLTYGQPRVVQVQALDGDLAEILTVAGELERHSNHPLARAVVAYVEEKARLSTHSLDIQDVRELVGAGITGQLNGQAVTVASYRYFADQSSLSDSIQTWVQEAEAQGYTVLLVQIGQTIRGLLACADTVRTESQSIMANLNRQHIATIMLTGDNAVVAQNIAQAVGLRDYKASLLPADKLSYIEELAETWQHVAMVGDGVNDAPALARATVGIAMGGVNSAQAVETADVALMADGLRQLPKAVQIGQQARRLIAQNIFLSVGVKLAFVILALAGFATLWLAILADVGMLMVVALNGLRPLRMG